MEFQRVAPADAVGHGRIVEGLILAQIRAGRPSP